MDILENNNAVVLLQPTSPIRFKKSIDSAIIRFERDRSDSFGKCEFNQKFFWKKIKMQFQCIIF